MTDQLRDQVRAEVDAIIDRAELVVTPRIDGGVVVSIRGIVENVVDLVVRVEASRRDWAAEALRLQHELEELASAFHDRARERAEMGADAPQCDGECPNGDLFPGCPCKACVPADADPFSFVAQMHLCPTCGNKRCPGAADHANTCSGSNEPGQLGSLYGPPSGGGSDG